MAWPESVQFPASEEVEVAGEPSITKTNIRALGD
jgi:hypothetical protein